MAENIVTFKNLSNLPIFHGFSWGREAENMSEGFDDPNIIQERVANFLNSLSIPSSLPIIRISPDNVRFNDPDILEINKEILKRKLSDAGEIEVSANAIFTKEKDIILTVKPADCAICVIYLETKNGEQFVGLIHCSAWTTDKLLPFDAIEYLTRVKSADPRKIKIGITPAINRDFFYVDKKDITLDNWKGFAKKENGKIMAGGFCKFSVINIITILLNSFPDGKARRAVFYNFYKIPFCVSGVVDSGKIGIGQGMNQVWVSK